MSDEPRLSDNVKSFLEVLAQNDNFKVELRYSKCIESPECPYCHNRSTEPYILEIDLDDGEPFTVEGHHCMGCGTVFAESVGPKI